MMACGAFALILLVFLSGCNYWNPVSPNIAMFQGVDPAIEPYFERFVSETGFPTYYVSAGFTTSIEGSDLVGECIYNDIQAEIRIDPVYWASIQDSDILKEQIVFHELGHCIFHYGHIFDFTYGQPLSIMYPYAFNTEEGSMLGLNESAYVEALVNNAPVDFYSLIQF
jgi:hypothetical protein